IAGTRSASSAAEPGTTSSPRTCGPTTAPNRSRPIGSTTSDSDARNPSEFVVVLTHQIATIRHTGNEVTLGGPMRATVFVSTFFAASLLGGLALADKPDMHAAAREPRVDFHREHGDIVDKSYRHDARPVLSQERVTTSSRSNAHNPMDKSASK